MAETRIPRIPLDSPFSSRAARDTWAMANLAELVNTATVVTILYVANDEDADGAYTEWQWNGENTPNDYNPDDWIRILELARREVRQLYEGNFVEPFNTLDAKTNIQLRPVDGGTGIVVSGNRNLSNYTGIEFFAYGNEADIVNGGRFRSLFYDSDNGQLQINAGEVKDHLIFQQLRRGSLLQIQGVTVTVTTEGLATQVVEKPNAWVRLVVNGDISDDAVLTIPVVEIDSGGNARAIEDLAAFGLENDRIVPIAGQQSFLAVSTDAVLDSSFITRTSQGIQQTRLIAENTFNIGSSSAGTIIVFEPSFDDQENVLTLLNSAALPGFGLIVDNRSEQSLIIRAENPSFRLNEQLEYVIGANGKIRLYGLPIPVNVFTGWSVLSYSDPDSIRSIYEANFLPPYNSLERKKNLIFNYLEVPLTYAGDVRENGSARLTNTSAEGLFSLNESSISVDEIQIDVRLNDVTLREAFKFTRAGDQVSLRNSDDPDDTIQFTLTRPAVFILSTGTVAFRGIETYTTGQTQLLDTTKNLSYRIGVNRELSLEQLTQVSQGLREVVNYVENQTEIASSDFGKIVIFKYPTSERVTIGLPTLSARDSGFSLAVDCRLDNGIDFDGFGERYPFESGDKGLIYYDGENYQTLRYFREAPIGGGGGAPTDPDTGEPPMAGSDLEIKEGYERNYQIPYNTLDSKANSVPFRFHSDLIWKYKGDQRDDAALNITTANTTGDFILLDIGTTENPQLALRFRLTPAVRFNFYRFFNAGDIVRFRLSSDFSRFTEYVLSSAATLVGVLADCIIQYPLLAEPRTSFQPEAVFDAVNQPDLDLIYQRNYTGLNIRLLSQGHRSIRTVATLPSDGQLDKEMYGQIIYFGTLGASILDAGLTPPQVVILPLMNANHDAGYTFTAANYIASALQFDPHGVNIPRDVGYARDHDNYTLGREEVGTFTYDGEKWLFEHHGSSNRTRRDLEEEHLAPYNSLSYMSNVVFRDQVFLVQQVGTDAAINRPFTGILEESDTSAFMDATPVWRFRIGVDYAEEVHRDLIRSRLGRYLRAVKGSYVVKGWVGSISHVRELATVAGGAVFDIFLRDVELEGTGTFEEADFISVSGESNVQHVDFQQRGVSEKSNIHYSDSVEWNHVATVVSPGDFNITIDTANTLNGTTQAITATLTFMPDTGRGEDRSASRLTDGQYLRLHKTNLTLQGWVSGGFIEAPDGVFTGTLRDIHLRRESLATFETARPDAYEMSHEVAGGSGTAGIGNIEETPKQQHDVIADEQDGEYLLHSDPAGTFFANNHQTINGVAQYILDLPAHDDDQIGWSITIDNDADYFLTIEPRNRALQGGGQRADAQINGQDQYAIPPNTVVRFVYVMLDNYRALRYA